MTERQPSPPLSGLRRDLNRLTQSLDRRSQLATEEAVGAELLASREVVANLGLAWETAAELGDLYARQARYLVEDHAATLSALFGGSPQSQPLEVFGNHLERRLAHMAEGVDQGINVLSRQTEAACTVLQSLWAPFIGVVRQDWTGERQRERSDPGGR